MALLTVLKTIFKRVDEGDEVAVEPDQLCFGIHPIALSEKCHPQYMNMMSGRAANIPPA